MKSMPQLGARQIASAASWSSSVSIVERATAAQKMSRGSVLSSTDELCPSSVTTEKVGQVLPRWVGRLAAADVFTRSHAWEVVERLRIDA
jgi:hypothetical protein